MASNVLRNNFTQGIVSQRLWGQYNSAYYQNGCAKLENFIIHPQGGIERRYPTTDISGINGSRLIPFEIDEHTSYIIEIDGGATKAIRVWKRHDSQVPVKVKFDTSTQKESAQGTVESLYENILGYLLYTDAQASDIQFAQGLNGTKLILVMVHKNFNPLYFEYDPVTDSITYPKKLTHSTATFSSHPQTYVEYAETLSMFTTNDNPSVVFYYASRLWFAGSVNHPYRLWASRPFKPFNFQMVDYSDTVDDTATAQDIIDAVEAGGEYQITPTVVYTEVIREDNALLLEVGSSSNDRIMWMNSMGNYIVVGTASAEWMISGSINGLTQNAYQSSSYGSCALQPVTAGNDLVFAQGGNRKLRAFIGSDSGYSCPDLIFQCDNILLQGVKRMCFKRVPEPMLFCLLNDGNLAVLYYDRTYSLQGWAVWKLAEAIADICVVNTNVGQRVYVITNRTYSGTTAKRLEYFDEGRNTYKDGLNYPTTGDGVNFTSALDTITYERTSTTDGSSLGKKKRIYEVNIRTLDASKGTAGYYWGSGSSSIYNQSFVSTNNAWGIDDVKVSLAGGYEKYVSFKLRSDGDNPLTVDAISLFTEVE